MKVLATFALAALLSACESSRGFNRPALRSEIEPQRTVSEEEIRRALDVKPQLPHSFRLAVYLVPPPKPDFYEAPTWMWTGEDADRLLGALAELKSTGQIADAYLLPESSLDGSGRKAIRLAAARSGADAVLVVDGVADVDRYNNILAPTYILLVTALIVPGTVADALFMVNASLWDVANEYLYLGTEAESTAHQTAPAAFLRERKIIAEAKAKAVDHIARDIGSRLNVMAAHSK